MAHLVHHVAGGLAAAAVVMAIVAVWTQIVVAMADAVDPATEGDPDA